MSRSVTALTVALALSTGSCGAGPDGSNAVLPPPDDCEAALDLVVRQFDSEVPAYDYDPAADLRSLVDRSDVVIAGTIVEVARTSIQHDPDLTPEAATEYRLAGVEVLHPPGDTRPIASFRTAAVWAQSDAPDPLAPAVPIAGVDVVAFLHEWPIPFEVGIQGFLVGCGDGAASHVLEPPPAELSGSSLTEIAAAVRSVGDAPLPLPRTNPRLSLRSDGSPIADLTMRYDHWNGEYESPPDQTPSDGAVVTAGSTLTFAHPYAASWTIEMLRLDQSTAFQSVEQVARDGATFEIPALDPGVWVLDLLGAFPPADGYSGDGGLRYVAIVQVVEPDAACGAPRAADVTGVSTLDGCPAGDGAPYLDVGSLLPSFHCAPWPPTLFWRQPDGAEREFHRTDGFGGSPELAELPADAAATGFELPVGEILVAPSDPGAVFVALADGTVERWFEPTEVGGCA